VGVNLDQRKWLMDTAKAHADLFVGNETTTDQSMLAALAERLVGWADKNAAHGDHERRDMCLRVARMLSGVATEFGNWTEDDGASVRRAMEVPGVELKDVFISKSMDDADIARAGAENEASLRLFLGRWGASGLPLVKPIDVNWAAAMCATNVPAEFLGILCMPWPAFVIEVPAELGLWMDSKSGCATFIGITRRVPALGEFVVEGSGEPYDGRDTWLCIESWFTAAGGDEPWHMPAFMLRRTTDLGEDLDKASGDREDPHYFRTQKMISKLVGGVLMALHAGQCRPTSAAAKKRRARAGKLPTTMEFIVGTPVRARMVDFVRDFVKLGPRKMRGPQTVQTLVRGHWKQQPHGVGRLERKFIHIEPHWRGPEDAPIAVRPHVLGKSKVGEV